MEKRETKGTFFPSMVFFCHDPLRSNLLRKALQANFFYATTPRLRTSVSQGGNFAVLPEEWPDLLRPRLPRGQSRHRRPVRAQCDRWPLVPPWQPCQVHRPGGLHQPALAHLPDRAQDEHRQQAPQGRHQQGSGDLPSLFLHTRHVFFSFCISR